MAKLNIDNPIDIATKIGQWSTMGNNDLIDILVTNLLRDKGFMGNIKNKLGHVPIDNPQANWEKLMYVPTSFKGKKDKDGNEIPLSDEEKRKAVWNSINKRNITGDALTMLGTTGSILANINANVIRNNARNSASDRQRELYGATPEDRAAASITPVYQGVANIEQLLTGIVANRLYQKAAERRAAYLRSLMGSEYNNMGVPGMYTDSWGKISERSIQPASAPTAPTGGQK